MVMDKPVIDFLEASAAALWFARCVDQRSHRLSSVGLKRHDWARVYGTPVYLAILDGPNGSRMVVHIDATSGDVIFAERGPIQQTTLTVSAQTDAWLSKLGRMDELTAANHGFPRYNVVVGGVPLWNLNGYSRVMFNVHGKEFARFVGVGALPPPPVGKPTVSQERAIAIVMAIRMRIASYGPGTREFHAQLGAFYDEKEAVTKWAWKVVEGWSYKGRYHDSYIEYVDAGTGEIIDNQYFQTSRFMYHMRAPRVGLKRVIPRRLNEPLFDIATELLRQIGRSDVEFDSLQIDDGLRMWTDGGPNFEMDAKGNLLAFRAPAPSGKPADALIRGQGFIQAQYPNLPEGQFREGDSPMGPYKEVYFRQQAFGYDYFDSKVVSVDIGAGGQVARFETHPAASRPAGVPDQILSPAEIEKIALALAQPHVLESTSHVRHYATTQAQELGWYVDLKSHSVTLAYVVSVMFVRVFKNFGAKGGGTYYHFDAATGRLLDPNGQL